MGSPCDKFKIHDYSGLIGSLGEISNISGVFKIVIDSSSILALISRCKDDSVNIRSRSIRLSHLRYIVRFMFSVHVGDMTLFKLCGSRVIVLFE